jgi:uncharacterized protein (TIGR02145 family)
MLSQATATLNAGDTLRLTAAVLPIDANNKAVTWESSNPAVATVVDGLVTAVTYGTATITVTTQDGRKTNHCVVTVSVPAPAGSLAIGTTVWASVSVDQFQTFATRPDMITMYYQWNRATPWPATGTATEWNPTADESSTWMINPCPAGWRLPTRAEVDALNNNAIGRTWANAETRGNAVAGIFYGPNHATCRLPDNMNGCIFLSAGGWRGENNGNTSNQGVTGRYWTSNMATTIGDDRGIALNFTDTTVSATAAERARGNNIRCVQE